MLGAQLPPPLHFSFPRGCHFLISELHISKWHTSVTASWLFSFRHYPWTSIGGVEDVALPLPRHSPITCRPPPPSRPRVILWCGGSGLSANIVLMEQVLFRTVIRSVHFGVQFLHFFFPTGNNWYFFAWFFCEPYYSAPNSLPFYLTSSHGCTRIWGSVSLPREVLPGASWRVPVHTVCGSDMGLGFPSLLFWVGDPLSQILWAPLPWIMIFSLIR